MIRLEDVIDIYGILIGIYKNLWEFIGLYMIFIGFFFEDFIGFPSCNLDIAMENQ